ncbi:MAG TPA: primosomal protein N' [Pyrinomonadaceae bacterium]|nr:primosomal protein N' [Pyrinomonadaceae bacterium]
MSHSSETNQSANRFVEVALPIPPRRTFTYKLSVELADKTQLGSRVQVSFANRVLTGYVVALHDELDPELGIDEAALKNVAELVDAEPLINEEILSLTRWTADYYAASWGELLKAALPAGINAAVEQIYEITDSGREAAIHETNLKPVRNQIAKRLIATAAPVSRRELEREFGSAATGRAIRGLIASGDVIAHERSVAEKVKPKRRKVVRILERSATEEDKPLNETQERVLQTLRDAGGEMAFTDILTAAAAGASPVNTLAKRGYIDVYTSEIDRDPLADVSIPAADEIVLNSEQSFVLSEIERSVGSAEYRAFLLHGVTGSGKTEVYIRAMRAALEAGRSSLMLVPEISLTPIFSRRLRAVFGSSVAILHSNLSQGERFDEWRRIRRGDAQVVIGTRSAVFAPLHDLGLVIVDEEHDSSYRQNDSPFYNARDVAVMRASLVNAVAVLGSATPSLESFNNAQAGKYQYLQLQYRIGGRPLAKAELIDMREVFRKAGKDVVLSPELATAIEETHARGEQSIVLLNRRGFSSFVLCRSCGERLRCKNCDITLTYHRHDSRLVCHYCGFAASTPRKCPFCESEYLYFIGQGTEQIEDIVAKRFPNLRIARIDRDTMAKKGQMAKTLLAFDAGEIDMLVGTQMLAKGHDFHNVTLVGVISVDIGLGLPDFRSAERTFQILTQVAGRAGRGNLPGRVLIQTYYPKHYALRHAVKQDYEGFFNEEIRFRRQLNYPPFVVLASILVKAKDENVASRNAGMIKAGLDAANKDKQCRIIGVAPASLSRLKGEYRMQILVKSASRRALRETIETGLHFAEENGADMRNVFTEIDPVNLM